MRLCASLVILGLAFASPGAAHDGKREAGTFVVAVEGDDAVCRDAPAGVSLAARDASALHTVTPERAAKVGPGLTIVLRATDQLEEYPQAKAAFRRAADTWERTITGTPITIVVDVDYGSTYFGQPFPTNVLGVTDPQPLLLDDDYSFIRSHLVASASSDEERAAYASLPERRVPTDLGATIGIYAPSALFRALHFLPAEAKPKADFERGLGNPPAVAISSAYAYDFDPSDGVDGGARDFEAVVLHELGHVLGFTSVVGAQESAPSFPVSVSVLDLFRFRPGVRAETFASMNRVLHSGGDQVFFGGGATLPLSTGRQDASGGDGRQASHWKDEAFTGEFIGLMHPALKPGVHETLTSNDLYAFDRIGYTLAAEPGAIASLAAVLDGDRVLFTGMLASAPLDVASAKVTMLSGAYREIHATAPFAVSIGTAAEFTLAVPGFDLYREALAARLTLYDAAGEALGSAVADFGGGDAGGPELKRGTFRGRALKLAGKGFAAGATVEVDGAPIPSDLRVSVGGGGTRATVRADAAALGLRTGYNRIRLVSGGARSNLVAVLVE